MASFLNLHEPASATFKLPLQPPYLIHTPQKWRELGSCSGLGFGLGECCSWLDPLSRPLRLFFISVIRLFHFLNIRVFTGVALLISFKSFSFAFTTWLVQETQLLAYLGFQYAFLTKLNHFKLVRDVQWFLSLEHLEGIVGLFIGLFIYLFWLCWIFVVTWAFL